MPGIDSLERRQLLATLAPDVTQGDDGTLDLRAFQDFVGVSGSGLFATQYGTFPSGDLSPEQMTHPLRRRRHARPRLPSKGSLKAAAAAARAMPAEVDVERPASSPQL